MGFRNRMKEKSGGQLQKRHNAGTKTTGGGRYPTIFLKDKVPEGVEFWRCREGEHLVDIIPFEVGTDMPFDERLQPITDEGNLDYVLDLFVHMNVGSMGKPYVCPYENFGKPCPICEFIKANRLEKNDWIQLVAKHRVVYFLWVHDNREEERKGIQIYEASHFMMEEKIAEIAKLPRGGGYKTFSHHDKGKSLAWTRKGSGQKNTRYLGHRFIDRESPIPNKILDMTFPLDTIVNMHPSYEEIKKEFEGTLKQINFQDGNDTPFDNVPSTGDDVPFDDEPLKRKRKRTTDRKTAQNNPSVKKRRRR